MAIERRRPFGTFMDRREPFRDIQGEMNRLFDSFFGRPLATATGTESRVWMPVVDMYETKDDLILRFELPGVSEKDVSLSITDRSEEHTSELQSPCNLVCRLLLEKKKNEIINNML